jgi:hypothetical protein
VVKVPDILPCSVCILLATTWVKVVANIPEILLCPVCILRGITLSKVVAMIPEILNSQCSRSCNLSHGCGQGSRDHPLPSLYSRIHNLSQGCGQSSRDPPFLFVFYEPQPEPRLWIRYQRSSMPRLYSYLALSPAAGGPIGHTLI